MAPVRHSKGGIVIEPISLAAMTVTLLVPFLQRIGERVADHASDALADAAVPAVKRLYQTLKAKLSPGSYAANQLQGVEERPDSEGRQQALATALAEALAADQELAAQVERLVDEARAAGAQVNARDAGVVAGRDVHQHGQYVAGRDLHIGGAESDRR
jgi:hypothetical protein